MAMINMYEEPGNARPRATDPRNLYAPPFYATQLEATTTEQKTLTVQGPLRKTETQTLHAYYRTILRAANRQHIL